MHSVSSVILWIFSLLFMASPMCLAQKQDMKSDLPYRSGPDAAARCTLDLYFPQNAKNAPLLVWFHGGSLTGGHKADDFNRKVAEGFRNQGLAVAMVNYRQSPGVHFPTYVEDAAAAIAWTIQNAAAHGLDPGSIYVGGHSAGGYLALLATLDESYLHAAGADPKAICGVISLSAQTLTHTTVLQERGLTDGVPRVDAAAPLHFANGTAPRLLLMCGQNDVPARVEENELLGALLRRTRENSVTCMVLPDRDHMSIIEKANNSDDPAIQAIRNFMRISPKSSADNP